MEVTNEAKEQTSLSMYVIMGGVTHLSTSNKIGEDLEDKVEHDHREVWQVRDTGLWSERENKSVPWKKTQMQ